MPFEIFAVLLGISVAALGIVRWLMHPSPTKPDPWDAEVEKSIHEPESVPLCHRCLTPHLEETWFCQRCGTAVGPYNNYMPFLYTFSEGEVFRAGVTDQIRRTPVAIGGLLLFSLLRYHVFAPCYWYFLFRNLKRPHQTNVPDASDVPSEQT
jgi:hypothetical protein